MWNRSDLETSSAGPAAQPPATSSKPPDATAVQLPAEVIHAKESDVATIGTSVSMKGDLSASEDLLIDGRVEGRIDLPQHALTIGPAAHVKGTIVAKLITVQGAVKGTINAHDKLAVMAGGSMDGDVTCGAIAIQEGATFSGKVSMAAPAKSTGAAQSKALPTRAS